MDSNFIAELERLEKEEGAVILRDDDGGFNGFVHLEKTWNDEATIIDTARVSTGNTRIKTTENMKEKDKNLLRFLYEEDHGTPFETVYYRYRIIAPIFVLRQFVKHRISSWNEMSLRYREPFYKASRITQETNSSDGYAVLSPEQLETISEHLQRSHEVYQSIYKEVCEKINSDPDLDASGRKKARARARELCRYTVPVSEFSDVYWTINARSLFNLFYKRLPEDAQLEARQYAQAMFSQFKAAHPLLAEIVEEKMQ